ncbi:alpha/beta hydrolase [Weissella cibaria]|uniref:alpha/beta hydrolase n=1 Tax=Weissella cibaria TaxID=137591 RepID=UPI001FF6C44E|nr:alpha/beta hydrolase [Weissella cibaria]
MSASAAVAASAAVSGWNGATNMNTVNQVLGQLDGMLTNHENQVKQLKADLKDADATIATLTQQRDAANAKLATAQQDLLAAQQAVTALTSQLNQAKTENDSLRGQLDEKIKEIQQKIADGNRQVELKQQEVDRLSAQVGSLNGQLGNLQNQLTNVTNQYNDLQHASHAQISSLSSEVDDLRNQLRAAEQDAQGKPMKMVSYYEWLLAHRDNYPNQQVAVLNMYGDLHNGSHSDGRVTTTSAKSLRYLLGNRPKSYREKEIVGPNAQHSKLHENNQVVNREMINFLWGK